MYIMMKKFKDWVGINCLFLIEHRTLNVWSSNSWSVGVYNDNGRNIIEYVSSAMRCFLSNVECKEKRSVLHCEKLSRYTSKY